MAFDPKKWTHKTQEAFAAAIDQAKGNSNPEITPDHVLAALLSQDGTIALVHNGIIENATALRDRLAERGYVFKSDTDTEVVVHLIQELYKESLEAAVIAAIRLIEGTYGIAVISSRDPGKIVAARKGSPLLLGIGDGEYFVASDASAMSTACSVYSKLPRPTRMPTLMSWVTCRNRLAP